MKVLMLGWEFPPHISGGLGTACFGLTKALMKQKIEVLFVVPRLFGDEAQSSDFLINASKVNRSARRPPVASSRARKPKDPLREQVHNLSGSESFTFLTIPSGLNPYQRQAKNRDQKISEWNYPLVGSLHNQSATPAAMADDNATRGQQLSDDTSDAFEFSGSYGDNLLEEVRRYADVAEVLAENHSFDVIHVHDWMTFLAGVAAKRRSGKPLVVHVHSTEFDRSGTAVNREVFEIERIGLLEADRIVAVSKWTKDIIVSRYQIPPEKVTVVHNGVLPKSPPAIFSFPEIGSHFITFLGRVTHQKGPWFFVEAAQMVLQEFPEAHFIVAGAGDLLPQIIERVAELNMSSNFHFTGFLSGDQVDRIWSLTDVYVMPSVSEPFGIAPLEAIQGDVPVIISKQSGVAEVMPHAIKVDFWDTRALAAAICSVLRYESLSNVLRLNGKRHIKRLTWARAAREIKTLYHELTAQ